VQYDALRVYVVKEEGKLGTHSMLVLWQRYGYVEIWFNSSYIEFLRRVRRIAGRNVSVVTCFRLPIRPHRKNSGPSGWIFMKLDIRIFFEKSVEEIQVSWKFDKNNHRTFLIMSLSFLRRMRKVSGKGFREYRNIHFGFNNFSKIVPLMR